MDQRDRAELNRRRLAAGFEPITDHRNHAGVKDSANMYRTFGGAHYAHWAIEPPERYVKRLRAAGIRCRRVGEEFFVHLDDAIRARAVPGENCV